MPIMMFFDFFQELKNIFKNIKIPLIFAIFKLMSVFFTRRFRREKVMLNCRFRAVSVFKLGLDFFVIYTWVFTWFDFYERTVTLDKFMTKNLLKLKSNNAILGTKAKKNDWHSISISVECYKVLLLKK